MKYFFAYAVTVSNFSELFIYAATVFFLPELILHKFSVEGYVLRHRLEKAQATSYPVCDLTAHFECARSDQAPLSVGGAAITRCAWMEPHTCNLQHDPAERSNRWDDCQNSQLANSLHSHINRSTSECILECQRRCNMASSAANLFGVRTRAAVMNSATSHVRSGRAQSLAARVAHSMLCPSYRDHSKT